MQRRAPTQKFLHGEGGAASSSPCPLFLSSSLPPHAHRSVRRPPSRLPSCSPASSRPLLFARRSEEHNSHQFRRLIPHQMENCCFSLLLSSCFSHLMTYYPGAVGVGDSCRRHSGASAKAEPPSPRHGPYVSLAEVFPESCRVSPMPDVCFFAPPYRPLPLPAGSCMGAGSQSEHQASRNRGAQQRLCAAQRSAALSGAVHLQPPGAGG